MQILQNTNPKAKNNGKFIGAWVSDELFQLFTLFSLAEGTTKTALLGDCIETKLGTVKNSKFNLIEQFTERLVDLEKESGSKSFLKDVTSELVKKGLDDKLIQEITRKYEKKQEAKG